LEGGRVAPFRTSRRRRRAAEVKREIFRRATQWVNGIKKR
jgi:hypothetical protein